MLADALDAGGQPLRVLLHALCDVRHARHGGAAALHAPQVEVAPRERLPPAQPKVSREPPRTRARYDHERHAHGHPLDQEPHQLCVRGQGLRGAVALLRRDRVLRELGEEAAGCAQKEV